MNKKMVEKNIKKNSFWSTLNRFFNPFFNCWFIFLIVETYIIMLTKNLCVELQYKIIILSIWFLIVIITIKYWQERFNELREGLL